MKIDLSTVPEGDRDRVSALLAQVALHQKYNVKLQEALDQAYDWQKQAISFTKNNKVIGITCGNQMGKTQITCAILACHLIGVYPDWWEGKRFDRPVKAMAAGVDSNHNKNVIQERLLGTNNWRLKKEVGSGMIPRESIWMESGVTARGDEVNSIRVKHSSGGHSELLFKAYSQGREAAQGFPADLIMIDEQPDDGFWREALTRTRATRGHVICSFTPLKGATSLIETMMDLPPVPDGPEDKFGSKYKEGDGWAVVRASWHDAPHIPSADIESARRDYAFDYDARVYGMPVAGFGRIFPYALTEVTYTPEDIQIQDHWPQLLAIDIGHGHGRDPSVVIHVAWDKEQDIIYVVDEVIAETNTTRELTRMIGGMNHTLPVVWPNDANRSSMSAASSVAQQLREQGVNLLPNPFLNPRDGEGKQSNNKQVGINYINSRFADVRLKISIKCSGLIKEMEQYSYKESGALQDGKDHSIDAFRYGVLSIIQELGTPITDTGGEWGHFDEEEFHYNRY